MRLMKSSAAMKCRKAGIKGDAITYRQKHIMSVPYHDRLLVDRIDDGLDEEIDGIAADFAMQMKELTLAAFDRITKEVKRLSELMRKVNDWQT